jgi:hypothetical protein
MSTLPILLKRFSDSELMSQLGNHAVERKTLPSDDSDDSDVDGKNSKLFNHKLYSSIDGIPVARIVYKTKTIPSAEGKS